MKKAKNICLVVLDGCRADRMGVYGYSKRKTTPVIDELAKDGLVCQNNYSTSFCTMPSIVSALTGRYPSVHQATATWGYANGRFPFLTEILRKRGYYTFGISNNIQAMSPEMGFVRGYDKYYRVGRAINWFKESKEEQRGTKLPSKSAQIKRKLMRLLGRFSKSASNKLTKATQLLWYSKNDMGGARAVEAFFDALDSRPSEKPFFSYVNLPDTHHPYITVKEFSQIFGKLNMTDNLLKLILQQNEFEEEGGELNSDEFDVLQTYYDTCVRYSDHLFGEMVNGLRKRGIFDSTAIVIIGDHGGNTWEKKRLYGSASFTYQEEVKVPLILINGDCIGEISPLTSLIDVFPTVLDIAAVPKSEQPENSGKSILYPGYGHQYVIIDYPGYPEWLKCAVTKYPKVLIKYGAINRTMITSTGQKFIWLNSGLHERYDLNIDSSELNNLYVGSEEDLAFISSLQDAYERLIGSAGRYLEIYPHNDVGEGLKLLPLVDVINPNWQTQNIVNY